MPSSGLTGSRIRARRLDRGVKQAALARDLGISSSYLNLIEHNRRSIGGKLLSDIARALDTDPSSLSEGTEAGLLDALRGAASGPEGGAAAQEGIEQFAGRFPGWAGLVVAQDRRISALERALEVLNDRLTHDPFLSASVHDVLSTVTAIRATSAILVDERDIDPDWRARFHRNLYEDSQRLAESSQGLVNYLDAGGDADKAVTAPQEELEAWLSARGFHLPELETGAGDPEALIGAAGELTTASGRVLARGWLDRYRADAEALPLDRLRAAIAGQGADPAGLADALSVDLACVMRRLAALPEGVAGGAAGLVICDGSGTLTFRKPAPGFVLPRFGAACPLWPLYQVLVGPQGALRQRVEQAGRQPQRFLTYAVAQARQPGGFDGPVVSEATMLILPEPAGAAPDGGALRPIGPSCRICPREACPARREPSIVAEAG